VQPEKVSIIIPVYNGEAYLRQAVDSALAQTYRDCEVIVVDDGSKDGTAAIIESYGSRVVPLHKANGGTSSALNAGIRLARGEYIAWLSHDDLFLPRKTQVQVDYLRANRTLAACYMDYLIVDEKGNEISRFNATLGRTRSEMLRQLFVQNKISGCAMLIRAQVFERVGLFREDLKYTQDFDMWFRILSDFPIGYIPQALEKQRVHAMQQGKFGVERYRREELNMLLDTFQNLRSRKIFGGSESEECLWLAGVLSMHRRAYGRASRLNWHVLWHGPGNRLRALRAEMTNWERATHTRLRELKRRALSAAPKPLRNWIKYS
jgi:glycosyltransferase involved in cell wall biosynthesis